MTTQTLGAYFQCYKNPMATYKCLESFRKHYPTNTIVLLSDNGYHYNEMAAYFNCIYIHSYTNCPLIMKYDIDIQRKVESIIGRLEEVLSLIPEEYVMMLEDDVIINHKITDDFKYDINGFCPNHYTSEMINAIGYKYQTIHAGKIYKWSGHGGSVINREMMLLCLDKKNVANDLVRNWANYKLSSNICLDYFISLLINVCEGTIGAYKGHGDHYQGINENLSVQHQYKFWYEKQLPNEKKYLVSEN